MNGIYLISYLMLQEYGKPRINSFYFRVNIAIKLLLSGITDIFYNRYPVLNMGTVLFQFFFNVFIEQI